DDYIKVVKKRNLGLTARQKMFMLLLISGAYAGWLYLNGDAKQTIPFVEQPVDLGLWFIPICMFIIISYTNAVNLNDGVDGLCGTVSFIAALPFVILAGFAGACGIGLTAAALAGAMLGFLVWNLHPARVFMGDVGSFYIGAALCALAFGVGKPLLLAPVGVIYITETVSVILQVLYFKATGGKRLFKMSPIHHHFEMKGWRENKIVTVFAAITMAGCAAALLIDLIAN
ncbi:MAG: phospho-N-acetylmuramoyl-pentapeptide-transferase, partial [Oscillospiraceae bacterium]|nr:phospho-N-acetylmuramoyl-pentapeptide-transferase [Oscillospiraceae bacterium]